MRKDFCLLIRLSGCSISECIEYFELLEKLGLKPHIVSIKKRGLGKLPHSPLNIRGAT